MKLTKVTGWLSVCVCVGMALQDSPAARRSPLQTWRVLFSLPARQGWNAWKRHYCARTRPTLNGWVKVPFDMYAISKRKEKRAQHKLEPRIMFRATGLQSHRRINLPHQLLVVNLQFKLSFSHKTPQYTCTSYQGNAPAMIFCAMSIDVSSYKNTLHFDKWIQNSKKDKLL